MQHDSLNITGIWQNRQQYVRTLPNDYSSSVSSLGLINETARPTTGKPRQGAANGVVLGGADPWRSLPGFSGVETFGLWDRDYTAYLI